MILEKWYVPTALSKRETLFYHFAHERLLATGCDHLDIGAGANLTGKIMILRNVCSEWLE